ncbi:glycyl-radical enzyme activating protein [Geovibrio thiophilus]|uniref:glycyl-radical enzyme activating protein n=1 Tax=Geovibrio thiophilus TaxID=139438 RepID=UPI0019D49F7F|nr:glycyl-radical enzyme activating protein [Geovibrio thiophilus]
MFDIKKYAVHDGPGIRTTVFLKGCPLSCIWCHNPESKGFAIEKIKKELRLGGKVLESMETVGREMTVREVMEEIEKDILFYEESGGGVTFSGGEVFVQHEFLLALLKSCKEKGIKTCVDTSGYVNRSILEKSIPLTDIFLYDIKLMDEELHKKYCGVPNRQILENFRVIYESGAEVRLRFPVIPSVTDTEDNLKKVAEFAAQFPGVPADLLPYHKIGKDKYRRLGQEYLMDGVEKPSDEYMQRIADFFNGYGIKTKTGG